jgi:hypothetical protein
MVLLKRRRAAHARGPASHTVRAFLAEEEVSFTRRFRTPTLALNRCGSSKAPFALDSTLGAVSQPWLPRVCLAASVLLLAGNHAINATGEARGRRVMRPGRAKTSYTPPTRPLDKTQRIKQKQAYAPCAGPNLSSGSGGRPACSRARRAMSVQSPKSSSSVSSPSSNPSKVNLEISASCSSRKAAISA